METLEDGKPYMVKPYTVQYFERARFEHQPKNQPPHGVFFCRFGRRTLEGR